VVALLCQEEIYGQITVWSWAVMKLLYVMQLLILYISRPKLHLNSIHCVFILLATIMNQDNKYCMSTSSCVCYCHVHTHLIVIKVYCSRSRQMSSGKPCHHESVCIKA
jgi:hypothetical protein